MSIGLDPIYKEWSEKEKAMALFGLRQKDAYESKYAKMPDAISFENPYLTNKQLTKVKRMKYRELLDNISNQKDKDSDIVKGMKKELENRRSKWKRHQ